MSNGKLLRVRQINRAGQGVDWSSVAFVIALVLAAALLVLLPVLLVVVL